MVWQSVMAVLALTAQAAAGTDATGDQRIVTVTGYVEDWDSDGGGWVRLSGVDGRLSIPAGAEFATHWRLLGAAAERGVALRVTIDAAAGRLGPGGDHVVFPLCAIGAANGATFGDDARNCPASGDTVPVAERLLALGLAQVQGQPEAARETLSEAMRAAPPLPPQARALALRARGETAESLADNLEPTVADHDRLMAQALADYRQFAVLSPDEPQAHYAVARALVTLGGYPEALEAYREIGRRWPGEAFDVAVRIGALYRQQGEYGRALQTLDDHARGQEPGWAGMKFHYHRAWTLMLLDRLEEAEADIDQGLRTQPDYSSAYLLRACIRARQGRLDEALADEEQGLELLIALFDDPPPSIRADIERSRAVIATLREAVAVGRSEPVTAPCHGVWDRWSRPRERSPLLDRDGDAPA